MERKEREERVKKSIKEVENDLIAQKTVLRLKPAPVVSNNVDKGKGLIFGYESSGSINKMESSEVNDHKLLSATINSGRAMRWSSDPVHHQSLSCRSPQPECTEPFYGDPTVCRVGLLRLALPECYQKKRQAKEKASEK